MSGGTGGIIGAIAGAALAYFTGGISVYAGAALGSMVGGLFNKGQNTQGPRLDDLKVQVSTYGGAIPTVYGTARVGGNVIWSTDKLEIAATQTAGKGGGASNTTYQYYVHMAIALCYGPITGIQKIWQDGRLIYDMSSGASVGSALATAQDPYANLVVHYGDEAQLPDPVIESWEGVGNVPAYRGIAYVRMIAVACPGGRVPQFSFEVTTSATVGPQVVQQVASSPNNSTSGALIRQNGIWEWTATYNAPSFTMPYLFGQSGTPQPQGTFTFGGGGYTPYAVTGATPTPQVIYPDGSGKLYLLDLQNHTNSLLWDGGSSTAQGTQYGRASYDPSVDLYVVNSWNSGTTGNDPVILTKTGVATTCSTIAGDGHGGVVAFYGGVVYVVTYDGTHPILSRRDSTGAVISGSPDTTGPAIAFSPRWSALYVDANGVYLYVETSTGGTNTASIYKIIPATGTSAGSFNLLCSATGDSVATLSNTASISFYCNDSQATIGPITSGSAKGYNLVRFNAVLTNQVPVSSIITDQCTKAGLTAGQFDVSTLQDTVWGYIIASVASARSNLQPLLTACAIDAVDEDGKVKFFKRAAITSLATVTYNELACVDGVGAPGDPMPLTRTQEAELPSSISVNYLNPAYDYQTVTETARRSTDLTRNDQTVDLPMAGSADFAASVALMLLYDAWNERNRRTAQVSRKWAYLSAGDGVTIEYPQGTFLLKRISKATDTGTLIQWEVVDADATIYTQQAIGSAQRPALQVTAPVPPTKAQIIDGPIWRDADNNAGLYVAMSGYSAPFPGAELFVGADASSLESRGTVTNEAAMGFAETVPGAWVSTSIDETNLLTVNMGRFTLSSCTRDVLLAGATNFAAYGANGRWEYVAFRTVNSLGSGRYTLSGMLRGQRGTEWASGLHQTGDAFVMLGLAGTLRPILDVGAIGASKFYRAITAGRSTGTDQTYASTAVGLMPLSPINLRRSMDASNNITLTWDPRSRLSFNNLVGTAQLGETSESYSVDFFSSSAFTTRVGTLTCTTANLTVSAAQQTAFGLTPGAALNVNVYQVSGQVGNGRALQAIL